MGVTKKAKITFTCEPNLKDGLEVWAQSESRTLSNLIEMIVRQAYQERSTPEQPDRPPDPNPRETPALAKKSSITTKKIKR